MKPKHLLATVLCTLVLYPLSTGPFLRIFYPHYNITHPAPEIYSRIYGPLFWASSFVPGSGKVWMWYHRLWLKE